MRIAIRADNAVARCPSVRPSHAGIFCHGYTYILKVFSLSGTLAILVFPHQTGWQYSDGDLPKNGGVECKGGYETRTLLSQTDRICQLTQLRTQYVEGTHIKVKDKGLDTCYTATYTSHTRDQQR